MGRWQNVCFQFGYMWLGKIPTSKPPRLCCCCGVVFCFLFFVCLLCCYCFLVVFCLFVCLLLVFLVFLCVFVSCWFLCVFVCVVFCVGFFCFVFLLFFFGWGLVNKNIYPINLTTRIPSSTSRVAPHGKQGASYEELCGYWQFSKRMFTPAPR